MSRRLRRTSTRFAVILVSVFLALGTAFAIDLGDILKGGAIGLGVEALAPQINSAINKLLQNNKMENRQETRVVPIITFGKGTKVGAAQVIGEKSDVDKVKAVAQLEGSFSKIGFRALVPVDSLSPTNLRRVYGVGLSALVDYKL